MLAIEQVSTGYGESRIVSDVSLEVRDGQVVCLMGRNGVGKTTLLKAIMGLLKAKSGQIYFGDHAITTFSPGKRAQLGIGYVPQGRGIFPFLSVYENLLMGFEAVPKKVISTEAIVEVYEIFPVLNSMRSRIAGTLSGGQQQQLAIARALVSRPKLLILDEPTEGIQPSIVLEIERLILSLREQGKMSILLVEQFLDFALGIADHCYVMEKGSIVSNGPADALQQNVIKEYLSV
ncbi:MAG TPA: urea ABC transporter ATP-binding subunit UrtE [Aggregatilineales bacterium]|nr:urea ABC transporter ATP-binding subunit UrtE [Aggregatilineales bacterium]